MKKRRPFYLLTVCLFLTVNALGQVYTGHGYANGVAGEKYQMPGTIITDASGIELETPGVATAYFYDIANLSGPNLKADTAVTFGIYTHGTAADNGGQNKRGYNTTADANTAKFYTPIRWNGGSNLWRQGGQWMRYTIDFTSGDYNFIYRANVNSFAGSAHKFNLKIFSPDNMQNVLFERTIDLSAGVPQVGATMDNILRIGGGGTDSDWFKVLDEIAIPTGTYVIELSSPEVSYTHSSWGAFTFNKSSGYNGIPYSGNHWDATTDVVKIYEYDQVGDANQFSDDREVTVGLYNESDQNTGDNIRNYTDNPAYEAVRYNNTTNTMQANGAWFKYSFSFTGQSAYFFTFRGLPDFNETYWGGTVQVLEPNTLMLIAEYDLSGEVKFMTDEDVGQPTRWMYLNKPVKIPEGDYVLKIDLPTTHSTGLIGEFAFKTEHPENVVPKVINYNWPQSVRDDADLYSELYEVKIYQDGQLYDMFVHKSIPDLRPSEYPEDNGGHGVMPALFDRTFNFCQFDFTGEITVEATKLFGTVASRVQISPNAYGINPFYFDGRTVKFKLTHQPNRPNYISINFVSNDNIDDMDMAGQKAVKHGLMLFADKPQVFVPDKNAPGTVIYTNDADSATVVNADVIYFPAGDYDLKKVFNRGVIDLTKDGQKVYLEGGAYVRGAIWSRGKHNIWLYGRGIITGWDMLFHELLDANGRKEAFINFHSSDGCHVEGIILTDPTHHAIPTRSDSYFKNVKIIGWAYNQDGTRVGRGSHIEEMFTKTQDDRSYADRPHTYINSVEWPMRNGAFAVLGWSSFDGGNSTYDNIYFIHSEWERPEATVGNQAVLGSRLRQGANLENVIMRNLYLEDYTTLLCVLRLHYSATEGDPWNPADPGVIKNFLFENIKVEHPFISTSGIQKKNRLEGFVQDGVKAMVRDITFRNLVAGNELILDHNKHKYFHIDANTTANIVFEAVGPIHTLRATGNSGGKISPSGDIPVPAGTDQFVKISPNSGYRVKDVKIDYTSVGPLSVISLSNVASDHVIEVEFELGDNHLDLTDVIDINTVLRNDIDLGVVHTSLRESVINESHSARNLVVFPNPSNSVVTVKKENPTSLVTIVNTVGQVVIRTQNETMDVSNLNKGLYIVMTEGKQAKLIIK